MKKLVMQEKKHHGDKLPKDKNKMPWYYWFSGIVACAFVETILRQSNIVLGGLPMFVLYGLTVYWVPSLIWKWKLKSRQKQPSDTDN